MATREEEDRIRSSVREMEDGDKPAQLSQLEDTLGRMQDENGKVFYLNDLLTTMANEVREGLDGKFAVEVLVLHGLLEQCEAMAPTVDDGRAFSYNAHHYYLRERYYTMAKHPRYGPTIRKRGLSRLISSDNRNHENAKVGRALQQRLQAQIQLAILLITQAARQPWGLSHEAGQHEFREFREMLQLGLPHSKDEALALGRLLSTWYHRALFGPNVGGELEQVQTRYIQRVGDNVKILRSYLERYWRPRVGTLIQPLAISRQHMVEPTLLRKYKPLWIALCSVVGRATQYWKPQAVQLVHDEVLPFGETPPFAGKNRFGKGYPLLSPDDDEQVGRVMMTGRVFSAHADAGQRRQELENARRAAQQAEAIAQSAAAAHQQLEDRLRQMALEEEEERTEAINFQYRTEQQRMHVLRQHQQVIGGRFVQVTDNMALVGINTDLGSTTSSEEGGSTAAVSGGGSSGAPARGEEGTSGSARGGQGAGGSMKRVSKADRLWLRCLPMLVPEPYHVTVHERTQQARQLSRRSAVARQSPPDSGTEAGSESSAGEGADAEVEEQREQKADDGEQEEKQERAGSDEEQARGTKRKRTEGNEGDAAGGGSEE